MIAASEPTDTKKELSGLNARPMTGAECAHASATHAPLTKSNTRTTESSPAVASHCPLLETATEFCIVVPIDSCQYEKK